MARSACFGAKRLLGANRIDVSASREVGRSARPARLRLPRTNAGGPAHSQVPGWVAALRPGAHQAVANLTVGVRANPGDVADVWTVAIRGDAAPAAGRLVRFRSVNPGLVTVEPAMAFTDESGVARTAVRGVAPGRTRIVAASETGAIAATVRVSDFAPDFAPKSWLARVGERLRVERRTGPK